jgi:integrase
MENTMSQKPKVRMPRYLREESSGIFKFYRKVPPTVLPFMDFKLWNVSLGTKNFNEAVKVLAMRVAETDAVIVKLEAMTPADRLRHHREVREIALEVAMPGMAKVATAQMRATEQALIADTTMRLQKLLRTDPQSARELHEEIDAAGGVLSYAAKLEEKKLTDEYNLRAIELAKIAKRAGVKPEHAVTGVGDTEKRTVFVYPTDASLKRQEANLQVEISDTKNVQTKLGLISAENVPIDKNNPKLSEALRRYLASPKRSIHEGSSGQRNPSTEKHYRSYVNYFIKLHGDLLVSEITMEQVESFRDELEKPDIDDDQLTRTTVMKYIKCLRGIIEYCIDCDPTRKINYNPARRVHSTLPKTQADQKRRNFTVEERNIFLQQVLKEKSTPSRLWYFLLCAYTGLRPSEAYQLYRQDIKDIHGVLCVDVNTNPPKSRPRKTIKNGSSRRIVPVHPDIKEGLLRYIVIKKPDERIFEDLDTIGVESKKFGATMDRCGLNDPLLVFYSLRHTFKSCVETAKTQDATVKLLMGHLKDTTANYSPADISVRCEAVTNIKDMFDLKDVPL